MLCRRRLLARKRNNLIEAEYTRIERDNGPANYSNRFESVTSELADLSQPCVVKVSGGKPPFLT